jgi:hypothetical protein
MEVSIPLIQNQVIDHTGTYRIVQRTVNGQTGLVIEEYIPEPEPQNNTRAMIIDEDENNNENNEENNNNGQMVLRGQNNVRGLPDSTGTAIEGTFEINISVAPIIYININNTYLSQNVNDKRNSSGVILLKNRFTRIASDTSVSLQNGGSVNKEYVNIYKNSSYSSSNINTYNNWKLEWAGNNGGSGSIDAYGTGWYWFGEASSNYVCHICLSDDINDLGIFIIQDYVNYYATSENYFYVSSDKFEFYSE